MTTITKCDQCQKEGIGYRDDFITDWIVVKHRSDFSTWHNIFYPSIAGDYCGLECLTKAIQSAVAEMEEMTKAMIQKGPYCQIEDTNNEVTTR